MSPRAFRALLVTAILGVVSFSAAFAADSAPVVWTYDPQAPNGPCPSAPACEVWRRFRVSHPWPYQAFGLWEKGADGVVIISEPPPSLSREQLERLLRTVFAGDLVDVTYNRWPTGLDGWLEDVVLRVRLDSTRRSEVVSGRDLLPWQAPAGVVDRLRFIYRILHGITDGFWLDPLGSAQAAREPIAELRVPLSDIAGWLADSKRLWTHASGPAGQMTTRELYVASEPGVYRSGAGVVALVAPRGAKLASLASEFRRFAVASDLIVGGTELKEGGLLLLGRLRQIPLATLPPLRFETFETLAKNRADHLAQSYERQRIFAGRIRTGAHAGWDWAPILLSPQLDDTEFGTLLNLADQALKSWSQHGQVDYYAFGYPKPQKFPFGSLAASDYFRGEFGTTSLLFNWNTEALATITTVNGKEILTGDRTGALPILYRPSDGPDVPPARRALNERRIQEVADGRARDARDYFATLGDPILVRVLQNVLLCQAVQSFLVLSDPQDPPRSSRSDQVAGALEKRAAEWIAEVMKGRTGS